MTNEQKAAVYQVMRDLDAVLVYEHRIATVETLTNARCRLERMLGDEATDIPARSRHKDKAG